jgi:hypothetical protein
MELVLHTPIKREHLNKALDEAYKYLEEAQCRDSHNCSVHVHINCQQLTIKEIVTFASLYYILEPLLLEVCGRHRQGNLFCLSILNASGSSFALENISKGIFDIDINAHKYAALNLGALLKYGSLEFRAMRFPITQKEMTRWVKILLEIKDSALKIVAEEGDLPSMFSQLGLRNFVNTVVPTLREAIDIPKALRSNLIRDQTMDSLREIQTAIYNEQDVRAERTPHNKIKKADIKLDHLVGRVNWGRVDAAMVRNKQPAPVDPIVLRNGLKELKNYVNPGHKFKIEAGDIYD